jgi:hypothetical protein
MRTPLTNVLPMKKLLTAALIAAALLGPGHLPQLQAQTPAPAEQQPEGGAWMSDVYPNPASDAVHFDYRLRGQGSAKAYVEIFNLLGEVVWREELRGTSGTVEVQLAQFKRGVYFYRMEVEGQKTPIRKLVVR